MTTLYEKIGRRYVPVFERWHTAYDEDQMKLGTFRLTYCYTEGGRRYEYDVTPATAAFKAAAMIAKNAMVEAMKEASRVKPSGTHPFTKRQLKILERFRSEMEAAGGLLPNVWAHAHPYEIAEAGIKAVEDYKP